MCSVTWKHCYNLISIASGLCSQMVFAFISLYMDYCALVFPFLSKSSITRLHLVHSAAARL